MEKWFSLHHSMFTHTSCIHWPRLTLTDSISSKVTKVIMIIMMTNIKLTFFFKTYKRLQVKLR